MAEITHYVHRNAGNKVFVKDAAFFIEQGGLTQGWGRHWVPVVAQDIEDARRLGEQMLPLSSGALPSESNAMPGTHVEPGPSCRACAHSYMEPDADDLVCGHEDAGVLGKYVHRASAADGHCGPSLSKFKQHPKRNPNGTLKS